MGLQTQAPPPQHCCTFVAAAAVGAALQREDKKAPKDHLSRACLLARLLSCSVALYLPFFFFFQCPSLSGNKSRHALRIGMEEERKKKKKKKKKIKKRKDKHRFKHCVGVGRVCARYYERNIIRMIHFCELAAETNTEPIIGCHKKQSSIRARLQ
jgi:hypothetical protein